MKAEVRKEVPAFTLFYNDYNISRKKEVSWSDLKNDPIGTVYRASAGGNCGRDVYMRWYEIVYKSPSGILVIEHKNGTTDEPNPSGWSDEDVMIWIENVSNAEINTAFVEEIGSYESIKYGSDSSDSYNVDDVDDSEYWDDEGYPCEP